MIYKVATENGLKIYYPGVDDNNFAKSQTFWTETGIQMKHGTSQG